MTMTQLDVMRARADAERLSKQFMAKWQRDYQGKLAQVQPAAGQNGGQVSGQTSGQAAPPQAPQVMYG